MLKNLIGSLIVMFTLAMPNLLCGDSLPRPLICGYSGFLLGGNDKRIDWLFSTMGARGFNAVQMKVLPPTRRKLELAKHLDHLEMVNKKANENGLALLLYVYPIPSTETFHADWPEHKGMPTVVNADGNPMPELMRLNDVRVWKQIFANARELAEAHARIPFAALQFDIECLAKQYSYDDVTWARFCAKCPEYSVDTPANKRTAALLKRNDVERYHEFFHADVEAAIAEWLDSLHAIAPTLPLGYMPSRPINDWFTQAFERHLATDKVPAVVDAWDMYNGSGFEDSIMEHAKRVKANHPNNLFICWSRVNSYEPRDLAIASYQAAAHLDGFSMWEFLMMGEEKNLPSSYKLPAPFTAKDYLDALEQANRAIRDDVKEGTLASAARMPNCKPKALVAPLEYKDIALTQYVPDGTGEGKPVPIVLRDRQIVRIWAQAGEQLSLEVRHIPANKPLALHYVLLAPDGKEVRHESISPNSSEKIGVKAPVTGCYAFVATGGIGGQAWYSVTVFNRHYGVDCSMQAYYFNPQTVYVPGPKYGNSVLKVNMETNGQSHVHRVDDGAPVRRYRVQWTEIPLKSDVVKVAFEELAAEGTYSQDFLFSLPNGKLPLLFATPENRLKNIGE